MDSPLRNQGVSNDVQGSPFFKYLCSLSPIKQAKQVHVAQTYSELTFPPPPTVFVSPPVALQKAVGVYRNYKVHESSQKDVIIGDGKQQIFIAGSVVEHSKRLFSPLSEVQDASSFGHVSEFASAACTKGYDVSFVGTMPGDNDRLTTHHLDCSTSEGNFGAKVGVHRSLAHYSDLESAQPSDARDSGNEKKDSQILVPSLSLSNDEPCSSGNSFASQQNDLKELEMKTVYDTSDLTMDENSNVEPNVHVEKGGNLNHRVVRRRCLDFAASEARRLSGCMDTAVEYSPSSAQYSLVKGSAMFDSRVCFEIGGTSPKAQITSPLSDEALALVLKPVTNKTLAVADQHSGASLSSEIHSNIGLHLDNLPVGLQIQQWDGKSQGGPDNQSPASLHEVAESPDSPKRGLSTAVEKHGDGCKRCKCKKSRCLKLYCECFAAGVYCVDSCTCRDCFNKPDYEETVLGTRQQIESRNPLAFAPKIIRAAEPSPIEGDDSANTPASARHKRGCNCKKSLCLKKYCECYQAGVGCSEDCRCEGCKNVYGKKEGQDEEEEDKDPVDVCDKDHGSDQSDLTKTEKSSCKDLSPITPTFEKVWHGKSTSTKSGRKRSTEQLQSPLSNISIPKFPRSPSKSTKFSSLSYAVSTPFVSRCISEAPSLFKNSMSPRSISKISQLSPRWDVLDDICTLTPLPQHPTRPIPSTADSGMTASCYSQNTRTSDVYVVEDAMPFRQPNLQDTPTTPLPSASQFSESDDMLEDVRRPGFLKSIEEVVSESPLRTAMITCSPKRKRVTPPRNLE